MKVICMSSLLWRNHCLEERGACAYFWLCQVDFVLKTLYSQNLTYKLNLCIKMYHISIWEQTDCLRIFCICWQILNKPHISLSEAKFIIWDLAILRSKFIYSKYRSYIIGNIQAIFLPFIVHIFAKYRFFSGNFLSET